MMGAGDRLAGSAAPARGVAIDAALRAQLDALYADYAAALDERRYDDWVELFTNDGHYLLQPRENHDRGLPLATLSLEGKGMLRDRVYGMTQTLFHAPYYQRHVIGPLRVVSLEADAAGAPSRAEVHASYGVFRTKLQHPSEVFNVGRYVDVVVRVGPQWLFQHKHAIFDSELIPNSIIYPI
jgi:salicylate 5-hydroxylase small subunit